MTIAVVFGGAGVKMKERFMTMRDDIQVDVYTSVGDLLTGSKARNKVYDRVLILSKLISPPANTDKALEVLATYWRKMCPGTEFILVAKEGVDTELAQRFNNTLCSPICTSMLIKNTTANVLTDMIVTPVADIKKTYGCESEFNVEIEVTSYAEPEPPQPEPTPEVQQVEAPAPSPVPEKKGGFLKRLFGGKKVQNTENQENIANSDVQGAIPQEAMQQPSEAPQMVSNENMIQEQYTEPVAPETVENTPVNEAVYDAYAPSEEEFSEVSYDNPSSIETPETAQVFQQETGEIGYSEQSVAPEEEFYTGEDMNFSDGEGSIESEEIASQEGVSTVAEQSMVFEATPQGVEAMETAVNADDGIAEVPNDTFFAVEDTVDFDEVGQEIEPEPIADTSAEPVADEFFAVDDLSFDESEEVVEPVAQMEQSVVNQPVQPAQTVTQPVQSVQQAQSSPRPQNRVVQPTEAVQNMQTQQVAQTAQTAQASQAPRRRIVSNPNVPLRTFNNPQAGVKVAQQAVSSQAQAVNAQAQAVSAAQGVANGVVSNKPGNRHSQGARKPINKAAVQNAPQSQVQQPIELPKVQSTVINEGMPAVTESVAQSVVQEQPVAPEPKKGFLSRLGFGSKKNKNAAKTQTPVQSVNETQEQQVNVVQQPEVIPQPQEAVQPGQDDFVSSESFDKVELTSVPLAAFAKEEPVAEAEAAEEEDMDISFEDLDVGSLDKEYKKAEEAKNIRVVKEVIREPIMTQGDNASRARDMLSAIFAGKRSQIFLVTGDRGVGCTTFAYELAQVLSRKVPVLYYDGDTDYHGLLNYISFSRFCEYDKMQMQGAKLAKSTQAFRSCVMRFDDNFDILGSNYGVVVSDEEYEAVQSVVADMSNEYNVIIADIPFSKLHLCSELISCSQAYVLAEMSKRGLMNLACRFDSLDLGVRYKRRLSSTGKMLLTKGDSKVDIKKLKRYVSDIVEFEDEDSNWLNMKTMVRDKMSPKFLQGILE